MDWEVRKAGKNEFTLAPYPFRRAPLEFAILARRIPKRRYAEDGELQQVLTGAAYYNIRFTLRPGVAKKRPYAASA